jgi:hypothetical protein
MFLNIFKNLSGITAEEEKLAQIERELALAESDKLIKQAERAAKEAKKLAAAEKRKAKKAKEAEQAKQLTAKELATAAHEPYVQILGIEVDIDNLGQGAFELDWNDVFVAKLVRAGYPGKTDQDVVDNWFKEVCRNVLLETYEQEQADPEKRKKSKNG